jgi:hypothetical protein
MHAELAVAVRARGHEVVVGCEFGARVEDDQAVVAEGLQQPLPKLALQ